MDVSWRYMCTAPTPSMEVCVCVCVCEHKVSIFSPGCCSSLNGPAYCTYQVILWYYAIFSLHRATFLFMLTQRRSLWLHWNLRAIQRDSSCVLKCQCKVFRASFLPPSLNLGRILRVWECITMVAASNMHAPVHWERRVLLPHLV